MQRRMSRRRALVAAGAGAGGAVILSACGGGAGDGDGKGEGGFAAKIIDTTKDVVRGGTLTVPSPADPLNFDYYNFDPNSQGFANATGIKLFRIKPGYMQRPALEIEMDLASSYEFSPDKLTLTVKLNPQAKFSPLSSKGFHAGVPQSVANRVVDADDVIFSANRLVATATAFGGGAGELFYKVDPSAPILEVTAIDKSTVQFKLDHPHAPLLTSLASGSVSFLYVNPKEGANNAIDFLKTQIGGGPYYIESYQPSVGMTLKRNPNFELRFNKLKEPFIDTIDRVAMPDLATQTSQFRVGSLLNAPLGMTVDDRIAIKQEMGQLRVLLDDIADAGVMVFGQAADSPFTDVRMRQAMSYAWERDGYIKILRATDKLEANGIPPNPKWNTCYTCTGLTGWWLDPKDTKKFGENAKYYTLGQGRAADVAEAKKLMMAAIGKDSIELEIGATLIPNTYPVDVLNGFIAEAGFKVAAKLYQYPTFLGIYRNPNKPQGDWSGIAYTGRYSPFEPSQFLRGYFSPASNRWIGASPTGPWPSKTGDPTMNDLLDKLFKEFEEKKRLEYFHEFQRYHAKMNYLPLYPGGATYPVLSWPAYQNELVYRGDLVSINVYNWIDKTKPPYAS
jgi:ABC-type transport system substrate-binding protein